MFYTILGIIVVVALFLIFRDDHDNSYNKSEKGVRMAQQTRSFSHTQGKSKPDVVKKDFDLSFLDNIAEIKVILPSNRKYIEKEIKDEL